MHKIIMPRHRTLIRNAAANRIEQYHNTSFNQIKAKLEQRTHLFIVVLGMLIGSSIALGIGYHLSLNLLIQLLQQLFVLYHHLLLLNLVFQDFPLKLCNIFYILLLS